MHPFSISLLALALTASPSPASANLLKRAHHAAIKHSAGLARDLRVALNGLGVPVKNLNTLTAQSPQLDVAVGKIYCVSSSASEGDGDGIFGNGGGNGTSSSPSGSGSGSGTATASSSLPSSTSAWQMFESHEGDHFFDGWSFWTTSDPTNGIVDYVSYSDAQSGGLIDISSNGTAIMRVDTTETIGSNDNRKSVRITGNSAWNDALVILDAVHMPQGCGTWPAFWSNGPNWPIGGEIDIVEGVNDFTNNQATIHTNPGCSIPTLDTITSSDPASALSNPLAITGNLVATTNCAAAETNNAGCGIRSNSDTSYGSGFNSIGGGVYAMLWQSSGIEVYFFPRTGSIPSDITSGSPNPSDAWGLPMARYPATDCNMETYFYNHSAIFDTTLCGDWAGGVWNDTGAPGQEQSCATRTGYSTCEDFVRNEGAAFANAYWEINSVRFYKHT